MKRDFVLKIAFVIIFLASSFCSKAQSLLENPIKRDSVIDILEKPRTIYVELGGPGLAITVNYDTRFADAVNGWGYRAGIGYYNTGANSVFSIPLQVNYLYGSGSNFAEFGVGTTFLRSRGTEKGTVFQFDNVTGFIANGTVGYRYQQYDGGINFRLAFTPLLYDEGVVLGGGVSIGYTF